MLRRIGKIILGIFATIFIFILGILAYDKYNQPAMVASILQIQQPPPSLKVQECESPFTTDVLTTCAIRITPSEFPLLLKGYSFQENTVKDSSYSLVGPKVGQEFEVTTEFIVEPKGFKYGGYVRVLTNKQRDQAIVDLYIE